MTVVSLDMAYRSFREVLAGLTPTTPPSINRRHPDSRLALVKAEAGPETVDLEVACSICRGPLVAREGQFVLKYFLLRKAIPVKRSTARRARPP
jgi:hypothetical protein